MFAVFSCERAIIASGMYDTTDNHSCLSQNQQLFCSAFVPECVVFFATGIRPLTGSTIFLVGNLQVYYSLLLISAPVDTYLHDALSLEKINLGVSRKSQWARKNLAYSMSGVHQFIPED
jgi:hypothetical protein